MFLEHGLKLVRMDDIASKLGVSKRTIYEQFGDRHGLINACVNQHILLHDQQHELHDQLPTVNLIEDFLRMIDNWEEEVSRNWNFMTELQKYHSDIYERVKQERQKEGIDRLKRRLERGQSEGLFLPEVNMDFAAYVLSNSIQNIFSNPHTYDTTNISLPEAFRYIMICFFRGIATTRGIAVIDQTTDSRFSLLRKTYNQ